MTTNDENRNDTGSQVVALERQIRILEKKIARSEQSRSLMEEARDRGDALCQNIINELDEHKALVDEKNEMLESLSSKLSKYLAPQIYQSIFSGDQDVSLETKRKNSLSFSATSRTLPKSPKTFRRRTWPIS